LHAYSETPVGFVRVLSRQAKFKSYSRFRASHFFAKFLNRIPLCILEYLQMFFYANMINDERWRHHTVLYTLEIEIGDFYISILTRWHECLSDMVDKICTKIFNEI
jgi:hypothetical protein